MKIIFFVLLWMSIASCSSLGTMHTARPITEDATELSFAVEGMADINAPDGALKRDENGNEEYRSFDNTLFPVTDAIDPIAPGIAFQLRHGFTANFDAGLKLYSLGVDADFNFLLLESNHFAISIDPRLQVFPWAGNSGREDDADGDTVFFTTAVGIVWLPALFDVYHTKRVTMTIGIKGGMLLGVKYADINGDGHKHAEDVGIAWLTGASVGWKLRQSEKWRILPEIAAMYDFKNEAVHFAILIGWARVFY